jgi:uncharacterized damage-inducible protein DinB
MGGDGTGVDGEGEAEAIPVRFPLGPFRPHPYLNRTRRRALVRELAGFPSDLRIRVVELSRGELDTPVYPGGWTVRQVVHHLADAHLMGYLRFKLAVTQDRPEVPLLHGSAWSQLPDARKGAGIRVSLHLMRALHLRWVRFLRPLPEEDFLREYVDPERGPVSLEVALQYYVWHGRHHLGQILGVTRGARDPRGREGVRGDG